MTPAQLLTRIVPPWRTMMISRGIEATRFDHFLANNRQRVEAVLAPLASKLAPTAPVAKRSKGKVSRTSTRLEPEIRIRTGDRTGMLHATVDGAGLSRALRLIKKVLVRRSAGDPVTILVDHEQLWFHCRANEGALMLGLPAKNTSLGGVTIDASEFRRLALTKEPVTLHAEHSTLKCDQGVASTPLPLLDVAPIESEQGRVVEEAFADPAIFTDSLESVLYAMSYDEARVNLNALYIERMEQGTRFVTTDGHRMVIHESTVPWVIPGKDRVLEAHEVRTLPTLLKGTRTLKLASTKNGKSSFTVAGAADDLVWTLVIPEKRVVFPPYRQVVPSSFSFVCEVSGPTLLEALRPVAKPKAEKSPTIRIFQQNGLLKLERIDIAAAGVSSSAPLSCEPADPEFQIGVNAEYFLEAVENGPISRADIQLEHMYQVENGSSLNPIKLVASGPGWVTTAVIMPMRL